MKSFAASALFLALIAASSHALAATVQVNFVNPEKYTDVDRFSDEASRAMKAIEETLVGLGNRYLPQTATLRIEVQDIDLAGRMASSARGGKDVRVDRGLADPPKIHLHYILEDGGRVVMDKDESIHGLAYLRQGNVRTSGESFPYEKAMLEQWFRENFTTKPAASGQ